MCASTDVLGVAERGGAGAARGAGELGLGDVDHRLARAVVREPHHDLTLRDDLAALDAHLGDHAVAVGRAVSSSCGGSRSGCASARAAAASAWATRSEVDASSKVRCAAAPSAASWR